MSFKKLLFWVNKFYLFLIIIFCLVFVGTISIYKVFFIKNTYIYAKIKVGQGLWWASTAKPTSWYVSSLKKGLVEKNLFGQSIAEVLSATYYSTPNSTNQYDVYLVLKLKVNGQDKAGKYNFNRSSISIASPIDLEFPKVQVSGTIIDVKQNLTPEKYVEKIITLTKKNALPWEFEAIKIGDKYYNGEENIFEIINKKEVDTISLSPDSFGNYTTSNTELRKYIIVTAKIKVKTQVNQFIFGEDRPVVPGKILEIQTPNIFLGDYIVGLVE